MYPRASGGLGGLISLEYFIQSCINKNILFYIIELRISPKIQRCRFILP